MVKKRGKYKVEDRKGVGKLYDVSGSGTEVPAIENTGEDDDVNKYDEANALVIVSNKKKDKKKEKQSIPQRKVLSKKQQKKLMQMLKRKEKKLNREQVLQELAKYQVTTDEIKQLQSISKSKTTSKKRQDSEKETLDGGNDGDQQDGRPSSLKKIKYPKPDEVQSDPNVVTFNNEDDDSSGSESNDNESDDPELDEKIIQAMAAPLPKPKAVVQPAPKPENTVEPPKKNDNKPSEPATFVAVNRSREVEERRSKLPILLEEQSIMESIRYNDVVIICGETGSGKTTQLPQFLYEGGYAVGKRGICVTEPRRVAAISMSKRVAYEMNLSTRVVSYHIRYDHNITKDTKIRFVTDGVLLKELQTDFLLSNYSVVIIDEAHERSVFSDILIGLLSRIVQLRRKRNDLLKLIIMSATLRVDDFVKNRRLFKIEPTLLKIESRQYPVTVHFSKQTAENYVTAAFAKTCRIHRTKPMGGILVFVTGRHEVLTLVRKLKRAFPNSKSTENEDDEVNEVEALKKFKTSRREQKRKSKPSKPKVMSELLPKIKLDDFDGDKVKNYFDDEVVSDKGDSDSSEDSDDDDEEISSEDHTVCEPLHVLPLYSLLPKDKQDAVFKPPPPGHRLCVIATNVAETSLTIPDIKYVVDTGKVKEKVYDKTTGISTFIISWCSKASADQRAGRAGRTSAGHCCYRLYSSAVFNSDFPQFSEPEIVSKPIDDLVLQMKCLSIINVINFPFPTPPSIETLTAAEDRLVQMGALEEIKTSVSMTGRKTTVVTPLGQTMAQFPVSPRYARMLAYSYDELLPYVIALVSGLTVQEIFLNCVPANPEESNVNTAQLNEKWKNLRRRWAGTDNEYLLGDLTIILKTIGASEFAGGSISFSLKHGINHKAMTEVHKLRKQLTNEVNRIFVTNEDDDEDKNDDCRDINHDHEKIPLTLTPPNDAHAFHLRQVALAGFFDHVARRIDGDETVKSTSTKKHRCRPYRSIQVESPVFIDSHSILCDESPEFVVYQEIYESTRLNMRNVVVIDPSWLPLYSRHHCNLSDPLDNPSPYYDKARDTVMCFVNGTFGPHGWPLPITAIEYPDCPEKYKWFACFLLDGTVLPELMSEFTPKLLSSPKILLKSWIHLQPKLLAIANKLQANRVASLKELMKKWNDDKHFLLDQIIDWLPEADHFDFTEIWKNLYG